MKEYKLRQVNKLFESKRTCNRCEMVYDLEFFLEDWRIDHIHEFKIFFGYGSKYDEETWRFDLCEKCIEEIVGDFKIKPEID